MIYFFLNLLWCFILNLLIYLLVYFFISIYLLILSYFVFIVIYDFVGLFRYFRKMIFILNVKIIFYGISWFFIFLFKPKGHEEVLVKNLAIKKLIKKTSPSLLIALISYFVFFFLYNFFFFGFLSSSNGGLALAHEVTPSVRNKNVSLIHKLKNYIILPYNRKNYENFQKFSEYQRRQNFWNNHDSFSEKNKLLNDEFSWISFFRSIYNLFFGAKPEIQNIKQHHSKIKFLPTNPWKNLEYLNFSDLRKTSTYVSTDPYFDLICQSLNSNIKKFKIITDDPLVGLENYFNYTYDCTFKEYVSFFYEHKRNRSAFLTLLEADIQKCIHQPGIKINIETYEIFWKKFLVFHEINRSALLRLEHIETKLRGRGIFDIPYKSKPFPFIADFSQEITGDMFLMEDNKKLRFFDKAKIQQILLVNEDLIILSKLSHQYFEAYNKF